MAEETKELKVLGGRGVVLMNKETVQKLAYDYAKKHLPERINTESKENGDSSGILQVYFFEGEWFVRYLDAHVTHGRGIFIPVEEMEKWLKNRGMIGL